MRPNATNFSGMRPNATEKLMQFKQQKPGLNTTLVLYNTNIVFIFAKRLLSRLISYLTISGCGL